MRVHFFIPEHHLPGKERREAWLSGRIPDLLAGGKSASVQAWIFQTWAALRDTVEIELATTLPKEGIVVTLANCLASGFRAPDRLFIAAVAADFEPHPGAQADIVQNAAHAARLTDAIFMPHWPQPNLVPRDPARGARFETVAFFGDASNLAPELAAPEFAEALFQKHGLRFEIRPAHRWHDYSDVDAVVAIRDFTGRRHLNKPATKLYNAWLADVPFIGGSDSAYSAEGEEGRDFLCVRSPDQLIRTLGEMKAAPELRLRLVGNGAKKKASRSGDAIAGCWKTLCCEVLPQRADRFSRMSPPRRALWRAHRNFRLAADRIFRS